MKPCSQFHIEDEILKVKHPAIYCITNENSGKQYIGSALKFSRRIEQHVIALRNGVHNNQKLQCDFVSGDYFEVNLICELEDAIPKTELEYIEYLFISIRNSDSDGYNDRSYFYGFDKNVLADCLCNKLNEYALHCFEDDFLSYVERNDLKDLFIQKKVIEALDAYCLLDRQNSNQVHSAYYRGMINIVDLIYSAHCLEIVFDEKSGKHSLIKSK